MDNACLHYSGLIGAIEDGDFEKVCHIIIDLGIDPAVNGNLPIHIAALYGHFNIVEFLMQYEQVDPSSDNNYAIRHSANNGHTAIVEFLLRDKRVDSSSVGIDAIRAAAYRGHIAIVELLLRDKQVDPSAYDNYAIKYASENGHSVVVRRLLQDKRVNPSAQENHAIGAAIKNDHKEIVNDLLSHPLVYKSILDDYRKIIWDKDCNYVAYVETNICFDHIYMIKTRATEVCVALFDLQLPALLTVAILDELFPNCIRMFFVIVRSHRRRFGSWRPPSSISTIVEKNKFYIFVRSI